MYVQQKFHHFYYFPLFVIFGCSFTLKLWFWSKIAKIVTTTVLYSSYIYCVYAPLIVDPIIYFHPIFPSPPSPLFFPIFISNNNTILSNIIILFPLIWFTHFNLILFHLLITFHFFFALFGFIYLQWIWKVRQYSEHFSV